MSERKFVGVDPDLHTPAFACVNELGHLLHVQLLAKIPRKFTGTECLAELADAEMDIGSKSDTRTGSWEMCAIEAQSVQQGKYSGVRPQDLVNLGFAAGIIAGRLAMRVGQFIFPFPVQWKGSIPKEIHQARVLTKIGWKFEKRKDYCVPACIPANAPDSYRHFNDGDWKHLNDAIGLALFALERWQFRQTVKQLREPTASASLPLSTP